MKKVLLVLSVCLSCSFLVTGQIMQPNKRAIQKTKSDFDCVYKLKYKISDRNKFYPFNTADTIKLISFRYHKNQYPVTNDSLKTDSVIETRPLTRLQINTLTDIIYNNFYRRSTGIDYSSQCFLPRNAILFIDKTGKLNAYSLICFHCNTHEESSDKFNLGDPCIEKMEKLRQFFISTGINFGTDRTINEYDGEGPDEIIR